MCIIIIIIIIILLIRNQEESHLKTMGIRAEFLDNV